MVVSFGLSIILHPLLSGFAVGGTDLGFWFTQQGSIIIFVVLIFFYAWRMNRATFSYSAPRVEQQSLTEAKRAAFVGAEKLTYGEDSRWR